MHWFLPDYSFKRIEDIPTEFFTSRGIRVILLDKDNTLTEDNCAEVKPEVIRWLEQQREAGLELFVISNNREERVLPFAQNAGLGYIANAGKPHTKHLRSRLKELNVSPKEAALIGDQLFTDILCGNLGGCVTILVEPYALESYGLYKIKRPLEKPLLKRYYRLKEEGKST